MTRFLRAFQVRPRESREASASSHSTGARAYQRPGRQTKLLDQIRGRLEVESRRVCGARVLGMLLGDTASMKTAQAPYLKALSDSGSVVTDSIPRVGEGLNPLTMQ